MPSFVRDHVISRLRVHDLLSLVFLRDEGRLVHKDVAMERGKRPRDSWRLARGEYGERRVVSGGVVVYATIDVDGRQPSCR